MALAPTGQGRTVPQAVAERERTEELQRRLDMWRQLAEQGARTCRRYVINQKRLTEFPVIDQAGWARIEEFCGKEVVIAPGSVRACFNGTPKVFVGVRPVGTPRETPQSINFLLLMPAGKEAPPTRKQAVH